MSQINLISPEESKWLQEKALSWGKITLEKIMVDPDYDENYSHGIKEDLENKGKLYQHIKANATPNKSYKLTVLEILKIWHGNIMSQKIIDYYNTKIDLKKTIPFIFITITL